MNKVRLPYRNGLNYIQLNYNVTIANQSNVFTFIRPLKIYGIRMTLTVSLISFPDASVQDPVLFYSNGSMVQYGTFLITGNTSLIFSKPIISRNVLLRKDGTGTGLCTCILFYKF